MRKLAEELLGDFLQKNLGGFPPAIVLRISSRNTFENFLQVLIQGSPPEFLRKFYRSFQEFLWSSSRNSSEILSEVLLGIPSELHRKFLHTSFENSTVVTTGIPSELHQEFCRISCMDSPGILSELSQKILRFPPGAYRFPPEILRSSFRNSFEDHPGFSAELLRDFLHSSFRNFPEFL